MQTLAHDCGETNVWLDPDRLCYRAPPSVMLALQTLQVDRGYGQRGVIEEAADLLDGFASVAAELGRAVPEHVHARSRNAS